METLLLYLLPLAARFVLSWPGAVAEEWGRAVLSLVPLLVVLPSLWLPTCWTDTRREHVVRHAVYALSFTVAAAASVRWDVVADALSDSEEWATALVAYLGVGSVTLWWFCLSHVLENTVDPTLFTHQGDVAVLPLTLVAIATFAETVPDEAFQFSRSVVFYVPVVVAWATLHFCAYSGFAVRCVTTHDVPGFHFLAHAGLVVAAAQLTLLEVRAPPLFFQLFPVVAALLCQVTTRPNAPPCLRDGRRVGTTVVALAVGLVLGFLLRVRVPSCPIIVPVVACVVASLCLPVLAGDRWVAPGTLYATLLTLAVVHACEGGEEADAGRVAVDALLCAGGYAVAFAVVLRLVPATWRPSPPHPHPPRDAHATPQREVTCLLSPTPLLRVQDRVPCLGGRNVDLASFYPPSPSCPPAFRGVWWAKGNTFPMDLLCVHHAKWSDDGKEAHLWNRRGTTRHATLAGLALHVVSCVSHTRIVVVNDRWIRTDGWMFGPLRLCPDSYWLYRVSDDEMLRLVYDARGTVVWQYRLLRIARDTPTRTTRFTEEALRTLGDTQHWWVA